MSIVRVKNKFQVVIPERVRKEIGVEVGDLFEATAERGTIVLKPKTVLVVNRDEYTPVQRRGIDAQLARSLAEFEQGRSYGPFKTPQEMTKFLHEQASQVRGKAGEKSKRPA